MEFQVFVYMSFSKFTVMTLFYIKTRYRDYINFKHGHLLPFFLLVHTQMYILKYCNLK